jgi:hypothetical protein
VLIVVIILKKVIFMRKKVLRRTILLFLLAGIVFACMDEEGLFSDKNKLSPAVSKAKAWFESHADGLQLQLKALGGDEIMLLTPDWKKSFSNSDANCEVVEIDLISEDNAHFVYSECRERFEETKDRNYLASNIRLIVHTDKKTKETDGFIMIAYPDLIYAIKNKDRALKNVSYLKRDKDFGGFIYYYNMMGNFVNGWRYEDGTAYVFYPENPTNQELRSQVCYSITECTNYYTDWYVNGEYQETVYNGSDCVVIGTSCYETGNGGYTGGGGGGDTSSDAATPTTSKAKKIFRNSNMTEANWEKLEEMIEKIMEHCLGEALYNHIVYSLNGQTVTIQFNDAAQGSGFNTSTGGISLSDNMESNHLFHEMWHLYQAYQENYPDSQYLYDEWRSIYGDFKNLRSLSINCE